MGQGGQRRIWAVFAKNAPRGGWRRGQDVVARAVFGTCVLDLRGADVGPEPVDIDALALFGAIWVIVPTGSNVELTGAAIFGAKSLHTREGPPTAGGPVVRVRGMALFGTIHVVDDDNARKLGDVAPAEDTTAAREQAQTVAAHDGTVTILFTDVERSTELIERLGDLRAQQVLRAHNEIVRAEVQRQGGLEVNTQGDSFMVVFNGSRRALRCAVGIQRALSEHAVQHPDEAVAVRIGLHTGDAITEDDDLFGRSVVLASRIAAEAHGGEILVSSLFRELSDGSGEFRFGEPRRAMLKGLVQEHVLYPVDWEGGEPTA